MADERRKDQQAAQDGPERRRVPEREPNPQGREEDLQQKYNAHLGPRCEACGDREADDNCTDADPLADAWSGGVVESGAL